MLDKPKETSGGCPCAMLPCKSIWNNSKAHPSHSGASLDLLVIPLSFSVCQTKIPISDKDLEDVVIFLTSSKPGNFISPEDLVDCQKQWMEMKKRESREAKRGERRALVSENISVQTGNPRVGPEYDFLRPLS